MSVRWTLVLAGFLSLWGCSDTCPTGVCRPICEVSTSTPLGASFAGAPAAIAFTGFDLVVAYHDLDGELLLTRLNTEGALRGDPVPVGPRAALVASMWIGDGYGVVTAGPDPTAFVRFDPVGTLLERVVLTTDVPTAIGVVPTSAEMILAWERAGMGFAQRFDASGQASGDSPRPLGPVVASTPFAGALGRDGTMALAALTADGDISTFRISPGAALADAAESSHGSGDAVTAPALAPFEEGFLLGWGTRSDLLVVREVPGEGPDVLVTPGGTPTSPTLVRRGEAGALLTWLDADDGTGWIQFLGRDTIPRGGLTALGEILVWYGAVPTPAGAAVLYVPLPATGEPDVTVAFLVCD